MEEHRVRRGLVLEGGGAKGAYAFGCLRAFQEAGIAFDVVAGTSVGAINAVCWSARALDEGERLWRQLRPTTLIRRQGFVALLAALLLYPRFALWIVLIPIGVVMLGVLIEFCAGRLDQLTGPGTGALISLLVGITVGVTARTQGKPFGMAFEWAFWAALGTYTIVLQGAIFALALAGIAILLITLVLVFRVIGELVFLGEVESNIWAGVALIGVIIAPIAIHFLWRSLSLLDPGALRQLLLPIVQRGLHVPTYVCIGRAASGIDPENALAPRGVAGVMMFTLREIGIYVAEHVRVDRMPINVCLATLTASGALPLNIFPRAALTTATAVDGGVVANLPLTPVLTYGVDEIIVIHLRPPKRHAFDTTYYHDCVHKERLVHIQEQLPARILEARKTVTLDPIAPGSELDALGRQVAAELLREFPPLPAVRFIPIHPAESLGGFLTGTLRFTPGYVRRLLARGYADASTALQAHGFLGHGRTEDAP